MRTSQEEEPRRFLLGTHLHELSLFCTLYDAIDYLTLYITELETVIEKMNALTAALKRKGMESALAPAFSQFKEACSNDLNDYCRIKEASVMATTTMSPGLRRFIISLASSFTNITLPIESPARHCEVPRVTFSYQPQVYGNMLREQLERITDIWQIAENPDSQYDENSIQSPILCSGVIGLSSRVSYVAYADRPGCPSIEDMDQANNVILGRSSSGDSYEQHMQISPIKHNSPVLHTPPVQNIPPVEQSAQQTLLVQQRPTVQQAPSVQQTPPIQQIPVHQILYAVQTPPVQERPTVQQIQPVQQTPPVQQIPAVQQTLPIRQSSSTQQTLPFQLAPTVEQPVTSKIEPFRFKRIAETLVSPLGASNNSTADVLGTKSFTTRTRKRKQPDSDEEEEHLITTQKMKKEVGTKKTKRAPKTRKVSHSKERSPIYTLPVRLKEHYITRYKNKRYVPYLYVESVTGNSRAAVELIENAFRENRAIELTAEEFMVLFKRTSLDPHELLDPQNRCLLVEFEFVNPLGEQF